MAISNLQETLLMYTKYKSRINRRVQEIQMDILSATKQTYTEQQTFNEKQQEYFYYYNRDGMEDYAEEYNALCAELENELELRLYNIKSWEEQLTSDKLNYEVLLQEIDQNENTARQRLSKNIQSDFKYGGTSSS